MERGYQCNDSLADGYLHLRTIPAVQMVHAELVTLLTVVTPMVHLRRRVSLQLQ